LGTPKKDRLTEIIGKLRVFRACGPSDDPDEQTAVTTGYRYLLVQLKRLAAPLLPDAEAVRLNSLEVDVNDVMTVYEARAEVDALLPDIEVALERMDESAALVGAAARVIDPGLIEELERTRAAQILVRMCKEINSTFAQGNLISTILLMRAVLNHVPPLFGRETFSQVVANSGRSLKESFDYLENGLRKVA